MKNSIIAVLLGIGLILESRADIGAHAEQDFRQLSDEYFNYYLKHNPSYATEMGVHTYDDQLEDYSKGEVQASVVFLKGFQKQLNQIDHRKLSLDEGIDYELIQNHILSLLLEFETIRSWERDPNRYGPNVSNSIFPIMSRTFAPPEDRLKSVIAREKQIPAVFTFAKENLKNPPRIFTQIALDQLPGTIAFFRTDVPAAFSNVKDKHLLEEFKTSNQAVMDGLAQYKNYLEKTVLPNSHGDFRLGAQSYQKKLQYEEMLTIPLDDLFQIGMKNLRANQKWFKEVAHQIDPRKTVPEVLADLDKNHPPRNKILSEFRDMMEGIRKFIVDKKIVTIPSPVLPIIEETPSFERALVFASMDTPGPFEKNAKEAFFNVTLPEADWTAQKTEEYLEEFGIPVMKSTAIHEAFPGHYVQFLWVPKVTSKIRKIIGANSNIEGWAHYCEQMMLDEGFGVNDPHIRLGQLQDALLRNARTIVGLQMHRGKMTYEEGIQFFMKEGYQTHANAERETQRGTTDPTYLYYTIGKLEILKLREDYKKAKGPLFTLQDFHDRFLQMGPAPIKLIRRAMLGTEEGLL